MGKDSKDSSVDPSLTDPDWRWTVFDRVQERTGNVHLKKRLEVTKEAPVPDREKGPFEVIYCNGVSPDDNVSIGLYSRPLVQILQQYIPDDGDLKSLDNPSIAGRELYVVLDSLKKHIVSVEDWQTANASQSADGNREHPHLRRSTSFQPQVLTVDATPSKASNASKSNDTKIASNGECHREASLDEAKLTIEDGEGKDLASNQSFAPKNIGAKVPKHDVSLGTGDGFKREAEAAVVLTDEEVGGRHLSHLVRFLEAEYKDTLVKVSRMRAEKRVAWDMLWALLPRGTKVVYNCHLSDEMLCGVVSASCYDNDSGEFVVELHVWDYNGASYFRCSLERQISWYMGERSFSGLPVCAIEIVGIPDPEQLEERFLTNGKMFYELAIRSNNCFMQYTGPMFREGQRSVLKEKADGRVMIDLASFAKMNPQYPMGTAHPPSSWVSASAMRTPYEPTMGHAGVTDRRLIFAPAVVYGFSFALKKWGTFAVSGFREITFDTKAFEELTMAEDMKSLIHNLVSQYIATSYDGSLELDRVDPIARKGEGCVFLCYGPPGSGKTLTAESIADKLERPLWALSVSELGTTPDELEKALLKVLDIAAIWRAVLLLDEADVYLEKRTSGSDLVRNAMTGVFLRMLEYYRGVLFLTTNRIGTFDEAFRSRISVFLRYSQFSVDDRQKVWKTLLRRGGMEAVTDQLCSELSTRNLNGREIRNAIRTAQVWAKSTGEPFGAMHVKYVIGLLGDSLESLNEDLQSRQLND